MTVVVVNHLRFRDRVPEDTIRALRDAVPQVVAAGGLAGQVLQVDDRHLILLLTFQSADDADRVARDVGRPLMRKHIVPLLAGPTERSVGEVVASA